MDKRKRIFLDTSYLSLDKSDQLILSSLILALGYVKSNKSISFLRKLTNSTMAKIALGISEDMVFLEDLLYKPHIKDPKLITAILNGLYLTNSELNVTQFINDDDINLKLAAIKFLVKANKDIEYLHTAIEKERGVNSLISSYIHFGELGIQYLETIAYKGDKTARQTALTALTSEKLMENKNNLPYIVKILRNISKNDEIWHIRRNARITLMKIYNK